MRPGPSWRFGIRAARPLARQKLNTRLPRVRNTCPFGTARAETPAAPESRTPAGGGRPKLVPTVWFTLRSDNDGRPDRCPDAGHPGRPDSPPRSSPSHRQAGDGHRGRHGGHQPLQRPRALAARAGVAVRSLADRGRPQLGGPGRIGMAVRCARRPHRRDASRRRPRARLLQCLPASRHGAGPRRRRIGPCHALQGARLPVPRVDV